MIYVDIAIYVYMYNMYICKYIVPRGQRLGYDSGPREWIIFLPFDMLGSLVVLVESRHQGLLLPPCYGDYKYHLYGWKIEG